MSIGRRIIPSNPAVCSRIIMESIVSNLDMEGGKVSPATPVNGDDNTVDASTVRRLVIVMVFGALALAATFVGFSLEKQGVWPFNDDTPSVRIVVD